MKNPLLVTAYLVLFGVLVASYDSWSDNDLVVMAVVGAFLVCGLVLWVYIAQDQRNRDS